MDEQTRDRLDQYVVDLFAPEDAALRWIQAEAARQELPAISIRPTDGRLLQLLIAANGARKAVEIGTLAGYSAVWIARALPADGKLHTLEKSTKHAQVARAAFQQAGVSDKVELIEGDALQSLQRLAAQGPFDFVFIDADRANYQHFLAWAVDNLRSGGIVAAHNALRGGRVLAPEKEDEQAVVAFNQALARDSRLTAGIIAIGDGMAVAVKR